MALMRFSILGLSWVALLCACQLSEPPSSTPPMMETCGRVGQPCCTGDALARGAFTGLFIQRDPGEPCGNGSYCSLGYCVGGPGAPCDATIVLGQDPCYLSINGGFCDNGRCEAPVREPCGALNEPGCSSGPGQCRCQADGWTCTPERCCMPADGLCDRDPTVCCDGLTCDGLFCRAPTECGVEGGPCCDGCDPGLTCHDTTGNGNLRCINLCGIVGEACCAPTDNCYLLGNECRQGTCCNTGGGDCTAADGQSPDPSKCCSGSCELYSGRYLCNSSCGGVGQACCNADEATSPCALCARCDGPTGTCVYDPRYCPSGSVSCQPNGFTCGADSQCCSGDCDEARGLCAGTSCYPNSYWCGEDAQCCSGYCIGNTCETRPSSPPAPECPAGTYKETDTGPCIPRPAACSTGDIVCNCPETHGVWCHPECEFELSCSGTPNPSYPCR